MAPRLVLALVLLAMLGLSACKHAKQAQKSETTAGVVDTSTSQDTSKSIFDQTKNTLGQKYDSLSHKATNLFNSIFGKDTTKGYPVTAPPPPETPGPVVAGQPPTEPGFLKPEIKRKTEFDTSGKVTERDVFLGSDVRLPSSYTFDDYLRKSQENAISTGFEKTLHTQLDTGKSVEASTGILGDYGNISIPIPPSIVPTIFGRPSINLRVNGDVAIHLAYRDQQTYQTTGTNFYGSETGLDFKQEINISTNGTIGDKLKIGADWGSDRMFQFDNLLKFNYVGYPDEILQTFDAGNVTFNTPSKYIGIQNDLFGLKAVTRFGPLYVTMLAAQKKGERQNRSFGGGTGAAVEHIIKPWEYRRNRFWLDTAYIKYYEPYCSTIPRTGNDDAIISKGGEYIPRGLNGKAIQVWQQTANITGDYTTKATAWYNLPIQPPGGYDPIYRNGPTNSGYSHDTVQTGFWLKMDSTRYTYDPITGILILNQEPDDNQFALAVSYPVYKNNAPLGRYGEDGLGGATPLVLKLLKPFGTFRNPTSPAWRNIVKNTYYVGGQSFTDQGFSLRIMYQTPRGGQDEYMMTAGKIMKAISILGLDRYNNSNGQSDKTSDGLVDFGQQFNSDDFIIDPKTGTLVFPYVEPFGQRVKVFDDAQKVLKPKFTFDSNFYLPEIYNTQQESLRLTETKQTSINVKFAGGVSSTLVLNAFNLVEGSVKVTSGATALTEGKDYRVDYASGTVTILNPDYVSGASSLNVEYDVHDIFTNATKNVLGFRAEVPMLDAANQVRGVIGTTFMNYSMHLPTLKTRQGEEPLSNWIWGFDGGYKFDMPMITDALNALPIFNLKDKSELNIKADAAISLPNPNTELSPMAVDNGKSIAYLDDFEGGLNQFPLYMNYGRWHPSSQPTDSTLMAKYPGTDTNYWSNPINRVKGKMIWYVPQGLPSITDMKPNKSVAPGTTAQIMNVAFDPSRPGIYNPNPANAPPMDMWGGMVQYAPGLNVAATNTDAIELYIKIDNMDGADAQNAKLRFDIGRVSEDVIPNGRLDNEDINNSGRYDDGEDIGLDGLNDAGEQAKFQSLGITPWNPSDPNNDDYGIDPDHLNGQEGNANDAYAGQKPDNEDLDGNGAVNLDNAYYEYEIPLDLTNNRNRYVIGGNPSKGWYQLRIPLADFKRIIGTQDSTFSNVSYYRFWIDSMQKSLQLELYELMLVGSQWTRGLVGLSTTNPIGDTSLRIGYVSIEDNGVGTTTNYNGPDGVQRDIIPGQTATTLLGNEQSLDMMLRKVPAGSRREAQRIFPSPNDLFNYRSMAIWVHGDVNSGTEISSRPLNTINDTINRVWVYFRFGTDQFNYYEYRRPLMQGWQNIHVDFGTLTSLKARRNARADAISMPVGDGVPGSMYTVVGSPTLTNAQYFVLGADHEDRTVDSLFTDIWWDELRLLDANDQIDYAYTAAAELKLAEFGRIMGGMTNERPDFHRVDERFNYGRSLNLLWNVTGEFAMQKVLPKWMEDRGSKLPITISHSEAVLRPKYIVNTDVNLSSTVSDIQNLMNAGQMRADSGQALIDSLQLNNETLQVKNSFGASDIALRFPGSFFLIPGFVNRLNFGFGYGESYLRSPQYEFDRTWSWTGSARYSLPPLPQWSVSPLSWMLGTSTFLVGPYSQWKITPLPTQVSFAVSATRGREHSLNRLSTLSLPGEGSSTQDTMDVVNSLVPLINRVFTATRGMQINWKPFEGGMLSPAFDYSLDVTSNLIPLETQAQFDKPVTYDVNGNPIYNYDSVYYYQRSTQDILHDIFFKDGALARPGVDFNASQKVHMGTQPKLPGLFGLEKLLKPVFDYRVEYRWLNTQTNFQNAKQAAWNNVITTGIELNVRDLGMMIFGKPIGEEGPQQRGLGRGRGEVGVVPEEFRGRAGEDRESPGARPREQPRNPVERGEEMRIQSPGNPLGRKPHILDTMRHTEPVVRIDTVGKIHTPGMGTEGEKGGEYAVDTVLTPEAPMPEQPEFVEVAPSVTVKGLLQMFVQKPLFDWNGTRFNFTQTNQSLNNAIAGDGSGITNFLARGFGTPEDDQNGPSRAYQLGLITDPSGRLIFHWQNHFPFLWYSVRHGLREGDPYGGSVDVTDAFTQTNNFELATSRPLWNGASISLNWKVSFGYDERDALQINSAGDPNLLYQIKSGDVSRTFLSIPPLPFVGESALQSGILNVGVKYREAVQALGYSVANAHDSLPADVHNKIEQQAFMQGFETLPFFSGFLREYLPRLNYSFSWSGLEKFPLFWFADHASVRNAYNGTYKRSFRQDPGDSLNLTSLQTIVYGFRPLIAFDMSWDKLWNGTLTTSLNYDTQTEWAADYASTRITKRLSTTFGINAHYTRAGGLSIPFLKLNLKNQFGAQFMFSQTISSDDYYNFWTIESNPAGTSNGGLTKTTIEPRVSYTISTQVSVEAFYHYERTTPASSGLISPPTRLITAGFDVRLKIM